MSDLILYPRAPAHAASEEQQVSLRVWVGAFNRTGAPALRWSLNGDEMSGGDAPAALRAIKSVRPDGMLPPGTKSENWRRAFTGVYEFTKLKSGAALQPDTAYAVTVTDDQNNSFELPTRTLPAQVPQALDRWFNVLLVSCFHQAEDRTGLAGVVAADIKARLKPHLTLFLGDQVYLDLPPIKDFPDHEAWLADNFEKDYRRNWQGPTGYSQVLAVAPGAYVPDDHEYWNNYPHWASIIQNTWSEDGRARWERGAQAMFEGFQLTPPARLGDPVVLDVEPLSFFIADTRSKQDRKREHALSPAAFAEMERWVGRVIERKQTGVFVGGQSLFVKQPSYLAGRFEDAELPDYKDFNKILKLVERLAAAGRPLLCITGDVHWGRVLTAHDRTTAREAIHEVISSPASLVTTPPTFGGILANLFGTSNPWPRHHEAGEPFSNHSALGGRFASTTVRHKQKGNHVALLSFRQTGGGLEVRIKYFPIHRDQKHNAPVESQKLYLPHTI